jgi:hypothetical protein
VELRVARVEQPVQVAALPLDLDRRCAAQCLDQAHEEIESQLPSSSSLDHRDSGTADPRFGRQISLPPTALHAECPDNPAKTHEVH